MASTGGTFLDYLRMKRTSDQDTFETIENPDRLGNPMPIAYGGFSLATGVQAAFNTVERDNFAVYSLLGHYLAPVSIDRNLVASVRRLRETRSFSTRFVTISQRQEDGSLRDCLTMTVDFIASPTDADNDQISTLRYSINPLYPHQAHSELPDYFEDVERRVRDGDVKSRTKETFFTAFKSWKRYLEIKFVPGSAYDARVFGFEPQHKLPQDELPITERRSTNWVRSRIDLSSKGPEVEGTISASPRSANTALMVWILDGALSSIALTFERRRLDDIAAAASLDFAIRFTHDRPNMNRWNLHEIATIAGGWGRTFSQGNVYNESGSLVATMSQQNIMRPLPASSRI